MKPEHNARRTIIREWMSLPRDKRQTEEQAAAFAVNFAGETQVPLQRGIRIEESWPGYYPAEESHSRAESAVCDGQQQETAPPRRFAAGSLLVRSAVPPIAALKQADR